MLRERRMARHLRWLSDRARFSVGLAALLALGFLAGRGGRLGRLGLTLGTTASREATAVATLKEIHTAQSFFREGRSGDGLERYGTLEEIASAGLVGRDLAGGRAGYRFHVAPSATTSEFLWFAVAEPVTSSSDRHFVATESGLVLDMDGPGSVDTRGECGWPPIREPWASHKGLHMKEHDHVYLPNQRVEGGLWDR